MEYLLINKGHSSIFNEANGVNSRAAKFRSFILINIFKKLF
ncbi:MAG: hypothetical protein ACXVLQ_18460 [Bacteriovorax sp.]